MSVSPVDADPDPASRATKPRGFWSRISRALDALVERRAKRAVPAMALRHAKHDVDCYRRLMLKSAGAPVDAAIGRVSLRHVAHRTRAR
jgi:hypothetical protein